MQLKVNESDLISSLLEFQHVQRPGFNKETQQFDVRGIDDELFQAFLERGGLSAKVKMEEHKEFAINNIELKISFVKVSCLPSIVHICTQEWQF